MIVPSTRVVGTTATTGMLLLFARRCGTEPRLHARGMKHMVTLSRHDKLVARFHVGKANGADEEFIIITIIIVIVLMLLIMKIFMSVVVIVIAVLHLGDVVSCAACPLLVLPVVGRFIAV
jgi:hypothetical protein